MFKKLPTMSSFLKATASSLCLSLFWTLDAVAQVAPAAGAEPPSFGMMIQKMLPMFAIVFLIFYYMVVKPQQKKLKDQETLFTDLKKGDSVVTSSGIIGKVATIEKDFVLLEIAQNVKVKFERAHIVRKEGELPTKRDDKGAASAA